VIILPINPDITLANYNDRRIRDKCSYLTELANINPEARQQTLMKHNIPTLNNMTLDLDIMLADPNIQNTLKDKLISLRKEVQSVIQKMILTMRQEPPLPEFGMKERAESHHTDNAVVPTNENVLSNSKTISPVVIIPKKIK